MKPVIRIDDLPAPGEPLTEYIAPENQALLDQEATERAERIRAKLTSKQKRALEKQISQLDRQLKRAKYFDQVRLRDAIHQRCTELNYILKNGRFSMDEYHRHRVELATASAAGKDLNKRIRPHRADGAKLERLRDKIKAHYRVLEWEKQDRADFEAFHREAYTWLEQIKSVCRNSSRLNHSGKDSKGNYFCDIPDIERIIIKDDKVYFQIRTSAQTFFERLFGRWHSALPYDVDIKSLTSPETLENLSAACNRIVTAERSQNGNNLFWVISRMDSPDGIPKKLLYNRALDLYPLEDHKKTPWAAGVTRDRKIEYFNFEDYPHVLIAGSSGGGKSTHINSMIALMATANRPDELRFVMIDLKGGIELNHWKGLKHLMGNIVKTPPGVVTALQAVREIMENRLTVFDSFKAKNLAAYNKKAAEPMPRIIVFFDELSTLLDLGELTKDIHAEMRVLSSMGRAAGIHLVMATQHPSVDTVPGWIKTNMSIRISAKMPSITASQIILDTTTAAELPGGLPGRMVFSVGREEIIAQSPYITDDEINAVVRASELYTVDEIVHIEPEQVRAKFTEQDAIELTLTDCAGKLSPTMLFQIVGAEIISERKLKQMCKAIADRREIEHNGQRYKIRKERRYHFIEPVAQQDAESSAGVSGDIRPIDEPIIEGLTA